MRRARGGMKVYEPPFVFRAINMTLEQLKGLLHITASPENALK